MEQLEIINSTLKDIDAIFKLYDEGTAYQKSVAKTSWKGFERTVVEIEIKEKRQWKIVIEGQIAAVFVITFSDPFIWQEKDNDPAIYIHRIVTNPLFRGHSFVKKIIVWAKQFAKENNKQFIRMDTGSGNDKLNNYYISCGFNYLGITKILENEILPEHYKNRDFSLFEMRID